MAETTLSQYYRALDEGRIEDALRMLDPNVRFVMVLPAGTRRGHGRDDMGAYLGLMSGFPLLAIGLSTA